MRPRLVDWSLLAATLLELITGLVSFTVGRPEGRWLFWLHGVLGLAIVLLLVWKVARVWPRLRSARQWQGSAAGTLLSVAALTVALLAIGSGVWWSSFLSPLGYPNGLNWHVIFGILLTLLVAGHMLVRFKPLRRSDFAGRRTALRFLSLAAFGGALWAGQQGMNHTLGLPGAQRRFTGSREVGSFAGLAFPPTMWMFDNPAPVDPARFTLRVSGAVEQEQVYDLAALGRLAPASLEATLDCTGGWYTTQLWHGVAVAELLAAARPTSEAVMVSFVSTTGYRWSVPLAEAYSLLLAQAVGDDSLDHWRGWPLRLVAPGRRGFQWVKWVTEIQVLDGRDVGQWGVIFTSGLERGPEQG
jgi:DMSO/TMAO reductase YedYZ molybdopterin-dependent catalytic subunit